MVGCPHSGTSVLASILGAHSRAVAVPDSLLLTDALMRSADPRARLSRVLADDRLRPWNLNQEALGRELADLGGNYAQLWLHLVPRYAEAAGRPEARVWIDPTPFHARGAATLVELFPRARFVQVVRDGRAVAASVLPLAGGPNTVARAAKWWVELLAFGLGLELWGGPRVMRVRDEDLLANPHRTIPAVSAFAGLEYEPAMLGSDDTPRPEDADAWEERLTPRAIEIFESAVDDLLRYLGYPMRFAGRARPATVREHVAAVARQRMRAVRVTMWPIGRAPRP